MIDVFDPVKYSTEENEFLRSVLGQPPIVAMKTVPPNVIRVAVQPVVETIYGLIEQERHDHTPWIGLPAVVAKIDAFLEQNAKWAADKRRGAPRFPTMHSFDTKGRPHRSGIGSDSGQVRTYFDEAGNRVPFAINLVSPEQDRWTAPWANTDAPAAGLKVDAENKRIECLICGHTEAFNPDSRGSYNAARGRMSKHLRSATDKVEDHRELHTNEFSS